MQKTVMPLTTPFPALDTAS
jgi:hypothetical protein